MGTPQEKRRPGHHVVSRGLQQNFANEEKRVSVVDTRCGRLIDDARAIKGNWKERGFNEYESSPGVVDDWLERAFAGIERCVLNQVRDIHPDNAGPEQRGALANLFALHLVRNRTFRSLHDDIVDQVKREMIPSLAADPNVLQRFEREYGRLPTAGEIEAIATHSYEAGIATRKALIESTARQHDQIAEKLAKFWIQVIWTRPDLPGFILGDVPAVHANIDWNRYGYRDGLAIGDANLIIGPLARRVVVCLTAKPLRHVEARTRKAVDHINAVFWRASVVEVICHPDDSLSTCQLMRKLDRLPPSWLHHG